jgi:MoxR-like ATPase
MPDLEDPGMTAAEGDKSKAALVLDEIDKADPDVPNDLLEALDERHFTVPETGDRIAPERAHLLIESCAVTGHIAAFAPPVRRQGVTPGS